MIGARPAAFALLLATASACGSNLSYVRYRIPLDGDPADAAQARACARTCEAAFETFERKKLDCLGRCPGVQITADARCGGQDEEPRAMCWEVAEAHRAESTDDDGGSSFLGSLVGAIVEAAVSGKSRSSERRACSHGEEPRATAVAGPARASAASEPSREPPAHAPARPSPSRGASSSHTPARPQPR